MANEITPSGARRRGAGRPCSSGCPGPGPRADRRDRLRSRCPPSRYIRVDDGSAGSEHARRSERRFRIERGQPPELDSKINLRGVHACDGERRERPAVVNHVDDTEVGDLRDRQIGHRRERRLVVGRAGEHFGTHAREKCRTALGDRQRRAAGLLALHAACVAALLARASARSVMTMARPMTRSHVAVHDGRDHGDGEIRKDAPGQADDQREQPSWPSRRPGGDHDGGQGGRRPRAIGNRLQQICQEDRRSPRPPPAPRAGTTGSRDPDGTRGSLTRSLDFTL